MLYDLAQQMEFAHMSLNGSCSNVHDTIESSTTATNGSSGENVSVNSTGQNKFSHSTRQAFLLLGLLSTRKTKEKLALMIFSNDLLHGWLYGALDTLTQM